ncbi:hypothetical protein BCR42DRAFT_444626 [Absidia repens]|uniref:Reverse transcriptase domain-containing protein n=1 Tax=Absidia repens TaxID=90262 RepID=A0A1X2HKM2_9FUNG|nr:hypothetical protein BCR42DRAFT_444626 [Absidia repens]
MHRPTVFNNLTTNLQSPDSPLPLDNLVILGDFNYSFISTNRTLGLIGEWSRLLSSHFTNCLSIKSDNYLLPTFFHAVAHHPPTIDHIFASHSLAQTVQLSSVEYMSPTWTDHCLLTTTFNLKASTPIGKGTWRANPIFTTHESYQRALAIHLTNLHPHLNGLTPIAQWERIKVSPPPSLLHPRIDWYNKLISHLQHEFVTISQLRSGTQWMENSEKSPKYLAAKLRSRQTQQMMHEFQNPTSEDFADRSDDTYTMKRYAATFYQKLFDTEPVDQTSIDSLLRHITPSHQHQLTTPFTINDLITQSDRCANNSSPGLDGLGYPFLSLVFSHPLIAPIALQIYNSALIGNGFPSSWQDITMRLLPKKGDLGLLKNWRPISLINCDAKIFTRLINARLAPIAAIGLLLDQEKAYDRIHPSYLAQTLKSFGIPSSFTDMLISLFFSNWVQNHYCYPS